MFKKEGHTDDTFEEAYEIANKTYMKDEIGSCEEWENGYVFHARTSETIL